MAIKDKEGNVYKLTSPNPVVSNQNLWDHKKITLHNMFFPLTVLPDLTKPVSLDDEDLYEPPSLPTEDDLVVEPKPTPQRSQRLAKLIDDRKINLLCLPVKKRSYEDALYGAKYSRTQYGQKTSITGIVISNEDLFFAFWTEQSLEEKSVVYPTQTEMKRWWQVDKCENQSGGFLVSCSPSTISPDFSD